MANKVASHRRGFNKIVLIVVIGALVLVGLIAAVTSAVRSFNSQVNYQTFEPKLTPSSEIKMGEYPYVSACQALNRKNVVEIYGNLSDRQQVNESYYDVNLPVDDQLPYTTRCDYGVVNLDVAQSSNAGKSEAAAKAQQRVYLANGDDEIESRLKKYESVVKGDEELEIFVQRMRDSVEEVTEDADFEAVKVYPLETGAATFELSYHNVTYTLNQKVPKEGRKDKTFQQLSDTEMKDGIKSAQKALTAVEANVKNANTPQDPAPTILGKSDRIRGQAKAVEPCAVLTKAIFQSTSGFEENEAVRRATLPVDLTFTQAPAPFPLSLLPGLKSYPQASCEREYIVYDNGVRSAFAPSTSQLVSLDIEQAAATAEMEALQNKRVPVSDGIDKTLETSADWAAVFNYEDSPRYMFRVGPYLATVEYYESRSSGLSNATDEYRETKPETDHIKLISALADELKRQAQ